MLRRQLAAPSVTRQDCRLYRIWVLDPWMRFGGGIALGYVGETARMPFERLMEHIAQQPWAGDIVAWELDERVFASKAEVLRAEEHAIRTERPLYNKRHNEDNPWRVDAGPTRDRHRVDVRQAGRTRTRRYPYRRRRAWWVLPAWLGGLWGAGTLALGWALSASAAPNPWRAGAVAMTGIYVVAWWQRPKRRRRWDGGSGR